MSDENPNPNQYPLGEPSVLDYVKSLFRFGDGERIEIPLEEKVEGIQTLQPSGDVQSEPLLADEPSTFPLQPSRPFPWRSLFALGLALIAQGTFEPPHANSEI